MEIVNENGMECIPPGLNDECLVTQSCPTLCNPSDASPLGSSVNGVFEARILECVAITFSKPSEL